jgi:hypothetical protein
LQKRQGQGQGHILDLTHKAIANSGKNEYLRKKSDPNFQFLTHPPLFGGLNDLKNNCTQDIFSSFST